MTMLDRREFLRRTTTTIGAALGAQFLGCGKTVQPPAPDVAPVTVAGGPIRANDVITLGQTGIKASRLAVGCGSNGGRIQADLGIDGMVKLLRHGLDRGLFWWDTASSYHTVPHVEAALKEVKRDQVVITCKTRGKNADAVRADIEKIRQRFNTDYIDILLLHCMTDRNWPTEMRESMDVFSEAKQKGQVGALGCSFHSVEAIQAAAAEPWGDVGLVRLNPFAAQMDVDKSADIPEVEKAVQELHRSGKVVYGMKIIGGGDLENNGDHIDRSLRFVMSKPYVDAFTIGFGNENELDDIMSRIETIGSVV